MDFQQQKKKQLSKSDKSSIGSWDSKIKGLCEKINRKKEFYTTSSCGGRVVLLKASSKKIRDAFLFRTHSLIGFKELKNALSGVDYDGLVEFQMSCCILHVACCWLEDAFGLVHKAKEAGWKRSGVMGGKRNIVELHSTENMSFPIMSDEGVLVDDEFLKLVVDIANEKLERCWEKIGRLKKVM